MELDVDVPQLNRVEDHVIRTMLRSTYAAVKSATRSMEKDLEGQTRTAVRGNAWRAWRSDVYPSHTDIAREPAGEVTANGGYRSRGMLLYWSQPGINKAVGGKYLAVPMNYAAGILRAARVQRGRNGNFNDVATFTSRTGIKLRPVFRPGKTPLLVADGADIGGHFATPGARRIAAKRAGGQRVQEKIIPMFALIPFQRHADKVSLEGALARAALELEAKIWSNARRYRLVG